MMSDYDRWGPWCGNALHDLPAPTHRRVARISPGGWILIATVAFWVAVIVGGYQVWVAIHA